MSRACASLSLDLDNLWSYLKTHGDPGWKAFPSYLDVLVPRVLEILAQRRWRITFFVVGQDAVLEKNRGAFERLAAAGHEIASHSFHHEPWLHRYSRQQLDDELARTEDALMAATGVRPTGFRGPGYSCSNTLLEVLHARGYKFNASTLPTWIGPLARRYYFMRARLTREERETRAGLFGTLRDAWRPIEPYRWRLPSGSLLEIPVTTMPYLRLPFQLSYVLYVSLYSQTLARTYLRTALRLCRSLGVEPSLLLHPLDFLGGDEVRDLDFFPAMRLPGAVKRQRIAHYFDDLARYFDVMTMGAHARRPSCNGRLVARRPDFTPDKG